jgi:predicted regulator of Ras-like GTPase activity (Roadblock/LC7/MglB family)
MKIPFLNRFKRGENAAKQAKSAGYQGSKPSTISKPEGERLSKTVRPNVTRTVATEETPEASTSALNEGSPTPRAVSFGPTKKTAVGRNKDLPPAVAFALEPRVERAISLELADVFRQMPPGLTKPLESLDKSRRILVKASELEKKMAIGRPTLSLASLHHQAPEIFLKPVAADDTMEIALPFDKVLEAFMQMQVRRDQVSDDAVPQVETPFLQVTKEDSEKFGVPNEPLPAPAKAPVRAEAGPATAETELSSERFMPIPATAAAIAAANPEEAAATELIRGPRPQIEPEKPLRIPLAKQPEGKSGGAPKGAPERIAFHLPPKETGAPASERVPASSGPPVSTPSPATRIPFQKAPQTDLPQMGSDDKKISLPLKPILQSLPVFELSGDPKEVPDEARIEFSFSLIHSQLSSGRIAIAPELFERALPADGRRFFTAKNLQVPVILPLQEVLKNLPSDALQMRGDQEVGEVGETIETPFSTTAAEDAKRFGKGPQPIAPPETAPPTTEPAAVAAPTLDAKSAVARMCALPGVRACSLCFTDGLSLAGTLPSELGAEAVCTIAPSLLERIEPHLTDSKIGSLQAMTLHGTNETLTFFKHANVCLAALHADGELTEEVRTELSRLLVELSRTYSQTDTSHVDH